MVRDMMPTIQEFRVRPAALEPTSDLIQNFAQLMRFTMRNVFAICVILLFLPQVSLSEERLRTISVNGNTSMTVKAEYAKIFAQVRVVKKTVEASYQATTTVVSELAKTLQKIGVKKEDLIVSVISQGAEYNWAQNTRTLIGYYSACSLQIKVNTLQDTYRIHEELAQFPELTVGQTEYGRNDESLLQTAALQEALKAAQTKARAMAETLGCELGRVLNIREAGADFTPISRPEVRLTAAAADPGEVSTTGSVSITGNVSVDFEIR